MILNDFDTSWDTEVSAKVVSRKIQSIENAFWLKIQPPNEIHANFRDLIEVELRLLRKATYA